MYTITLCPCTFSILVVEKSTVYSTDAIRASGTSIPPSTTSVFHRSQRDSGAHHLIQSGRFIAFPIAATGCNEFAKDERSKNRTSNTNPLLFGSCWFLLRTIFPNEFHEEFTFPKSVNNGRSKNIQLMRFLVSRYAR